LYLEKGGNLFISRSPVADRLGLKSLLKGDVDLPTRRRSRSRKEGDLDGDYVRGKKKDMRVNFTWKRRGQMKRGQRVSTTKKDTRITSRPVQEKKKRGRGNTDSTSSRERGFD